MIVFAVLWLVATGLLVWVYTDQETVRRRNADLETENRRLISPGERQLAYVAAAREGLSAVKLIEDARKETALLATGKAEDDPAVVFDKTDQKLQQIVDDGKVDAPGKFQSVSLLEGLDALYTEYVKRYDLWQQSQAEVNRLNGQLQQLAEAGQQQQAEFEARTREVANELASIKEQWQKLQTDHEDQIAEFQERYDDFRRSASEGIQELRSERDRLGKDLNELSQRFAELQEKLGELQITPVPLQTLREPDGVILTAQPGEDVVYINLGRDSQLTLGMQFAVYPEDTGIPVDGDSKARIEVVSIYDRSAACKVVEQTGSKLILEGDLIANPVYDRARPLTFLVIGEFDLNQDTRIDTDGQERIKSLIEAWGGQTVDTVSARIDFVVAGTAPREPRVVGEMTPEIIERTKDIAEKLERFTLNLEQANSLSIPVLTQPILLRFLGYNPDDPLPAML
jgi:hypothetical protein